MRGDTLGGGLAGRSSPGRSTSLEGGGGAVAANLEPSRCRCVCVCGGGAAKDFRILGVLGFQDLGLGGPAGCSSPAPARGEPPTWRGVAGMRYAQHSTLVFGF